MSKGWMRVREAAHLMDVSQSTVRRRVDSGELRGRTGRSGRQEVFLPAKLRRELEAKQAEPCTPGHKDRGRTPDEMDAIAKESKAAKGKAKADAKASPKDAAEHTTPKPERPGTEPSAEGEGDDLVKRYARLAGGSLILAQQHSDAVNQHKDRAYEQLAHTRSQVRQLRKLALAGWGSCAAAVLLGLVMTVTMGMGKARAEAAATANEEQAERAERRAERINDLLTVSADRAPDAGRDAQTPGAAQTPAVLTLPGHRLDGPTVAVPTE